MNLEQLPDYGDLIPLKEWLSEVDRHNFMDYDGHGYWATPGGMLGRVVPSDITHRFMIAPSWATHVMWFNR